MAMHYYLYNKEEERPQEHNHAFNTSCVGEMYSDDFKDPNRQAIITKN